MNRQIEVITPTIDGMMGRSPPHESAHLHVSGEAAYVDDLPEHANACLLYTSDFNRSYRDKFGFPFVVCVRNLKSLAELFAQQECRLQNARPTELTSAIREVGAIAQLRVESFIRE